ncbi:endo-1,4-beta-xylanase [Rufibacter quisquiliarum]|uniref:Beta-xylanase n=1 Tax=Rufibacter quisquiliarum TaxID=1549639 RepID=A0A839GNV4_9BACT|nr:endo-1,4-beta-xylanase [Rufibacter quisquiliarum]MBA9076118.1 endo-1,4-beta-xylanase [Rufibacter quisquiliarum]
MKKHFWKTALLCLGLAACGKEEEFPKPVLVTTPPVSTDGLHAKLPFPFGAAVNVNLIRNNAQYRNLVAKEMNSITAENAMKPAALHPSKDLYVWNDADYLVEFAKQSGKRVHGHTLIWHQSLPAWLENYNGTPAEFEQIFKTHIQTIVSHFKGKVASWDVVNEAFENEGGTLRNSVWRRILGDDYIARAFQYAHEADPAALLFYNDYGHEYGPTKRNAIINLVNSLKARGIPIHGIGMQMHTRYNQSDANLTAAITTAASTGLKVHISELDISMNPEKTQGIMLTPATAQLQATRYKFIVKAYNGIPKEQQFGITTWNVTDGDSWVPGFNGAPDWPLPFDKNYQPKPAYQGIIEGVQ